VGTHRQTNKQTDVENVLGLASYVLCAWPANKTIVVCVQTNKRSRETQTEITNAYRQPQKGAQMGGPYLTRTPKGGCS